MPQFDKADLVLRARRRADMEFSEFIATAEGEGYVETAFQELYLKVVSQYEDACVASGPSPEVISNSTTQRVDMPTNFLRLKALLLEDASGRALHFLRPVTVFRELEPFIMGHAFTGKSGVPTHYWFHGMQDSAPAQAVVYPYPDTSYTVQIFYVPNITIDTVTGGDGMSWLQGWDEYVVLTAAMKMKDKEESDCSVLLAERSQLWDSMIRQLEPLDQAEPTHVVQLAGTPRNQFNRDPYDSESFG